MPFLFNILSIVLLFLMCSFRVSASSLEFNVQSFQMHEATSVSLLIETFDGSDYSIAWNMTNNISAASGESYMHNYLEPYSGVVSISGLNSFNIKKVIIGGAFAFDIQNLYNVAPHIESIVINQGSLCYGNIASKPTSLTYIDCQVGDFYGNFNKDRLKGVTRLRVVDGNSISLNVADFDVSTIYIGITGANLLTGYIDSLNCPNLSHLDIKGLNTITGDLGKMQQPIPRDFNIGGKNTINEYTPGSLSFVTNPKIFILAGSENVLSTEAIDALLIDLDNASDSWSAPGHLFLTGEHEAPSSFSEAARASLIAKGANLATN